MTISLPENLARYVEAQNRHDIRDMVACFALDAHVRDEGHEYVGLEAIGAWKRETSARYQIAVEPVDLRSEHDQTVMTAKVSGAFAGSPATLSYRFGFAPDGTIKTLEIR